MFGQPLRQLLVSARISMAFGLALSVGSIADAQTTAPRTAAKAKAKGTETPKTPLDLNKATAKEMEAVLPGYEAAKKDPRLAKAIEMRKLALAKSNAVKRRKPSKFSSEVMLALA